MFKEYVINYGHRFQYPDEAIEALAKVAHSIEADETMRTAFADAYTRYCSSPNIHVIREVFAAIKEKAATFNEPQESVLLLLFIAFSHPLEAMYQDKNLPQRYFEGAMADLRAKLYECHKVRHIWGSSVADWFMEFFSLDRFAIGRLQYNFVTMPACSTIDGKYTFNGGEKALTIHIPSTGPLLYDDIEDSLKEAAAFYADEFEGDRVLFTCSTWLLYSAHEEMLPENSNIRRFREHFSMCPDQPDPRHLDLWRIFGTEQVDDISALPRTTGLQKAYAAWLEQGKPIGRARGVRYINKSK